MSDLASRVDALHAKALERRGVQREVDAAAAESKAARSEQVRAELREQMPVVAALVDEFRAVFGEGVRVLAACENGRSVVNARMCERLRIDVREYATE